MDQQLHPGGHLPALAQVEEELELPLELVSTVTDSKVRATFVESHPVHRAFNPLEYAEIDARISNVPPQSSHM